MLPHSFLSPAPSLPIPTCSGFLNLIPPVSSSPFLPVSCLTPASFYFLHVLCNSGLSLTHSCPSSASSCSFLSVSCLLLPLPVCLLPPPAHSRLSPASSYPFLSVSCLLLLIPVCLLPLLNHSCLSPASSCSLLSVSCLLLPILHVSWIIPPAFCCLRIVCLLSLLPPPEHSACLLPVACLSSASSCPFLPDSCLHLPIPVCLLPPPAHSACILNHPAFCLYIACLMYLSCLPLNILPVSCLLLVCLLPPPAYSCLSNAPFFLIFPVSCLLPVACLSPASYSLLHPPVYVFLPVKCTFLPNLSCLMPPACLLPFACLSPAYSCLSNAPFFLILPVSCLLPVACLSPASYFLLPPTSSCILLSTYSCLPHAPFFLIFPVWCLRPVSFFYPTCLLHVSSPAPYSCLAYILVSGQFSTYSPHIFGWKKKFKLNIYFNILLFCHFPDRLCGWSGNRPVSFKLLANSSPFFKAESLRTGQIYKNRCLIVDSLSLPSFISEKPSTTKRIEEEYWNGRICNSHIVRKIQFPFPHK